MLDKEICKKCINRHRQTMIDLMYSDHTREPWPWRERDDEAWARGTITCANDNVEFAATDRGPVPRGCFYYLEQLMMTKGKHD